VVGEGGIPVIDGVPAPAIGDVDSLPFLKYRATATITMTTIIARTAINRYMFSLLTGVDVDAVEVEVVISAATVTFTGTI
jgi:hypothetical protein